MKTVFKYRLELQDYQELQMPEGAQILSVQVQHDSTTSWDNITLWALVDDSKDVPKERVGIVITGTGRFIPNVDLDYLGTVQKDPFVWHIWKAL